MTGTNSPGSPARVIQNSASKVGSHTTLPRPPENATICRTTSALRPPTEWLRATPPKISMPGTSCIASHARSAVIVKWFLRTIPRMPARFAIRAISRSPTERGLESGPECTWKSMIPAMLVVWPAAG